MTIFGTTGFFGLLVTSLTPVERWQAARRINTNLVSQRQVILIGLAVVMSLLVMLLLVSISRRRRQRTSAEFFFAECSEQRGLSARERRQLHDIAERAGLQRSDSIFTMAEAFERGSAELLRESSEAGWSSEGIRRLETELSSLREKLGFGSFESTSKGSVAGEVLSSRQIPVGRRLSLTQQSGGNSGETTGIVVENSYAQLSVKLSGPVTVKFGEPWCVRYRSTSSVWEFETSIVSYDGETLALGQSDKVRFVNRRRFLRVPVIRQAFIAHFPFTRALSEGIEEADAGVEGGYESGGYGLAPLEFVPATVTELGGPGLRIESALEVKVGDRVLVLFRLDEGEDPESMASDNGGGMAGFRMVEDLGTVRHVWPAETGYSIAVELTGLDDSDIDELTRATNAALLSFGGGDGDSETAAEAKTGVGEGKVLKGA